MERSASVRPWAAIHSLRVEQIPTLPTNAKLARLRGQNKLRAWLYARGVDEFSALWHSVKIVIWKEVREDVVLLRRWEVIQD